MPQFLKPFLIVFLSLSILGCASVPKGFLKPSEGYLEKRQLQMRQYDTTDEKQVITAVAGVLQDLGFTLDDSETEVGFVAASKKADATSGGQVVGAAVLDTLGILFGGYSNVSATVDAVQHVKASVITKPSLDGNKVVVRITLQRIIWNRAGQVNRIETVNEPAIYQKFYESLSKAIFLEAQKI
jgi:hypothetical protein